MVLLLDGDDSDGSSCPNMLHGSGSGCPRALHSGGLPRVGIILACPFMCFLIVPSNSGGSHHIRRLLDTSNKDSSMIFYPDGESYSTALFRGSFTVRERQVNRLRSLLGFWQWEAVHQGRCTIACFKTAESNDEE